MVRGPVHFCRGEVHMSGKDISVRGADGSFGGYLASPASGHGPGVIVIQEIFGVNIQNRLGEASKIRKPLMLHIAAKDQFVPPEAQKQITDSLKGNSLVTIHVYPEMDHAFAREGGQHYDKACADLANSRTDAFFRQHLG